MRRGAISLLAHTVSHQSQPNKPDGRLRDGTNKTVPVNTLRLLHLDHLRPSLLRAVRMIVIGLLNNVLMLNPETWMLCVLPNNNDMTPSVAVYMTSTITSFCFGVNACVTIALPPLPTPLASLPRHQAALISPSPTGRHFRQSLVPGNKQTIFSVRLSSGSFSLTVLRLIFGPTMRHAE